MMKIMVQLYGYNVVEARDGVEAIEKVKQHCPDLILMDIAMPLMDGLSAARVIKTFEHCSKVPVIAVTAYHKHLRRSVRGRLRGRARKTGRIPAPQTSPCVSFNLKKFLEFGEFVEFTGFGKF